MPGGGGAFPGGIGGLVGGAFLGLCGGLGGGGGTLSAMTILCWQPEGLFERIGDMMSFIKNYAGYLINEIHGIGASFSIAPKPSSSITNKLDITFPPNLLHNLVHASTVPPVAKRSSIIIIFWPSEIASTCISSLLVPYSKEYSMSIVLWGSFPGFLTGMNPMPNLDANSEPKMKPRDSGPRINSGSQLFSLIICTNLSVISLNNVPSERIGEISRNIMPSIGKLGIVLTVDFRS